MLPGTGKGRGTGDPLSVPSLLLAVDSERASVELRRVVGLARVLGLTSDTLLVPSSTAKCNPVGFEGLVWVFTPSVLEDAF